MLFIIQQSWICLEIWENDLIGCAQLQGAVGPMFPFEYEEKGWDDYGEVFDSETFFCATADGEWLSARTI